MPESLAKITRKGRTLYLIKVRARGTYACKACGQGIPRGDTYYRDDPHPYSRTHRGLRPAHYCLACIDVLPGLRVEQVTQRIRVPEVVVHGRRTESQLEIAPLTIRVLSLSAALASRLADDPDLLHRVSAGEFGEIVCDRLVHMGLEVRRVGNVNQRDGGIDIVFWPRASASFPFLGAAQVKHRRGETSRVGPAAVREFAGVLAGHPFNAGLLVTNTVFTPDAEWFASRHARLLRLRDFSDMKRWLRNDFADELEWREIPARLELCPGVVINLR